MMKYVYFLGRALFGICVCLPVLALTKIISTVSDLFYFLEIDETSFAIDNFSNSTDRKVMHAYNAVSNSCSPQEEI